jgi:archaemetzincin
VRLSAGVLVACVWVLPIPAFAGEPGPARRPSVVDPDWPPLPRPGPDDWLTHFPEGGQTYAEYVAERPTAPTPDRRTIYLLPFGDVADRHPELVAQLALHDEAYFGCPVRTLPAEPLPPGARRAGRPVRYDGDLLLGVLKRRLPRDALALTGLTRDDLTSGDLNFVFGVAWSGDRVAVHSIHRYLPRGGERGRGQDRARASGRRPEAASGPFGPASAAPDPTLLRRTLKTATHELAHVLELDHCVFYSCVMNGSNTLEESDRTPLHACPECRKKLATCCGLKIEPWYRKLAGFYRTAGLADEASFVWRQLARLARGEPAR